MSEEHEPSFEDVWPDLEIAHELLVAAFADDHDAVDKLKESRDEWWNVAWTLALLFRGVFNADPASLALLQSIAEDVEEGHVEDGSEH
jgi:hypothetical protein